MTPKEKRQKAAEAVARAQAIRALALAENRATTQAENVSFDAAMDEHDALMADAARDERAATAAATLAETRNAPVRGGAGATVHDRAEDRPWGSFGNFLRSVVRAGQGREVDPRLAATRSASGLDEGGAPDEGGFLVVPEYATELVALAHDTGILLADCNTKTLTTPSNSMVMFGIDETSRANGSRFGGVQSYWANEADTVTATKPKFRRMQLTLNKLFAICYATDEMLEDSTLLGQVIQEAFVQEMGFKADDSIINGKGSGQPLGILVAPAVISIAKESGQTNATVVYANVLKMKNAMYPAGRKRAKWYVNLDVIPQLEQMYLATGTANGVPVYMPENVSNEGVSTLFGRPVVPVEQCLALGTPGDIIYADLSQYQMLDKGGIQAAQSMHVRFLYGENTFRFTYRLDGQPKWNSALSPYKGSTSVSPFVTLAQR